jgi:hypothetical protein
VFVLVPEADGGRVWMRLDGPTRNRTGHLRRGRLMRRLSRLWLDFVDALPRPLSRLTRYEQARIRAAAMSNYELGFRISGYELPRQELGALRREASLRLCHPEKYPPRKLTLEDLRNPPGGTAQ